MTYCLHRLKKYLIPYMKNIFKIRL